MASSKSLPGAYTAIEIGPSHLKLSDNNKQNWEFKMIISKKTTGGASAWMSCFDLLRKVSRGFDRSKKTKPTIKIDKTNLLSSGSRLSRNVKSPWVVYVTDSLH